MLTPAGLQNALNSLGVSPKLDPDGQVGKKTLRAVDQILSREKLAFDNWDDPRRFIAIEQLRLRAAGIEVGNIDGWEGPQTLYARNVYVARQQGNKDEETWRDKDEALVRTNYVSPRSSMVWPKQADVPKFFGDVATNLVTMEFPYPMVVAWDPSITVTHTSCNKKVVGPMRAIFEQALATYGKQGIQSLRLNRFGGLFNKRRVRGGSRWSMHAYGIACDIDPERNQLKWHKERASLDGKEYEPFWKIVESAGAISLGRERDYDYMHFQFARL